MHYLNPNTTKIEIVQCKKLKEATQVFKLILIKTVIKRANPRQRRQKLVRVFFPVSERNRNK